MYSVAIVSRYYAVIAMDIAVHGRVFRNLHGNTSRRFATVPSRRAPVRKMYFRDRGIACDTPAAANLRGGPALRRARTTAFQPRATLRDTACRIRTTPVRKSARGCEQTRPGRSGRRE